jgi:hypothetical protein
MAANTYEAGIYFEVSIRDTRPVVPVESDLFFSNTCRTGYHENTESFFIANITANPACISIRLKLFTSNAGFSTKRKGNIVNQLRLYKLFIIVVCFTVPVKSVIVDDFEGGKKNNLIGGIWNTFSDETDSGNSVIVNGIREESRTGVYLVLPTANEGHLGTGMMMKYKYGTIRPHRGSSSWGNQVGINTSLSSASDGIGDLTNATQVSFWAKSNFSGLSVRFLIPTSDVKDFVFYRKQIILDTIWTKYSIKIDSLVQPAWATHVTFNRAHAMSIQWDISADDGSNPVSATLWLDDVEIEGYFPTVIAGNDPSTSTNRRPVFRWYRVAQASTYSVQVYWSQNAKSPVWDSSTIKTIVSDTFYTPTADLNPGYVYWRVKSDVSSWSVTGEYRILDNRIPSLIHVKSPTINRRPLLVWHSPESGAAAYRLEVSTAADFATPLISVPVSDTFFLPNTDFPSGVIYWRIRSDLVSTWSGIDEFTILSDTIPFIVRYNGSATSNMRPVFAWNKVAGATSYKFMLAGNRSYADAISLPLSDTVYIPTVDLTSGKWYWKVSCDRNLSLFCPEDSLIIGATAIVSSVASVGNDIIVRWYPMGLMIRSKQPLPASTVRIYSISGRCVAAPAIMGNSGNCTVTWNFSDIQGRPIPSGIYLIKLAGPHGVTVHRVTKQ